MNKLIAFILLVPTLLMGAVQYPLKFSADGHYFVDQANVPVFIQGDSIWGLFVAASNNMSTAYFQTQQTNGVNSVIVDMIDMFYYTNDPANTYNVKPFTNMISSTYWDLNSVNPAYFTNVDKMIAQAGQYGMQAVIFANYLGSRTNSSRNGFYLDMKASGKAACTNYGKFLANRYKDTPNIMWVFAGDEGYGVDQSWVDAVAYSLLAIDSNHVATVHPQNGNKSVDTYSQSYDQVVSVYSNVAPSGKCLEGYKRIPAKPTWMLEASYEGDTSVGGTGGGLMCRQEAWSSVFSGACGHFFGNATNQYFYPFWEITLTTSPANKTIPFVAKFANSRQWYRWVPDTNHTFVTSGYGTVGTVGYVAVARDVNSNSIVAYLPTGTSLTPTVNMTKITGATAICNWYNPTNGVVTSIGTYPTTGSRSFTAPNGADWVLTVDAVTPSIAVNAATFRPTRWHLQ